MQIPSDMRYYQRIDREACQAAVARGLVDTSTLLKLQSLQENLIKERVLEYALLVGEVYEALMEEGSLAVDWEESYRQSIFLIGLYA